MKDENTVKQVKHHLYLSDNELQSVEAATGLILADFTEQKEDDKI